LRRDTELPRLAASRTDRCLPTRHCDRTDMLLPRCRNSITDSRVMEPNVFTPATLSEDPRRPNARRDIELARCSRSKTESLSPSFPAERRLRLLETCARCTTDSVPSEEQRNMPKQDRLLPVRTYDRTLRADAQCEKSKVEICEPSRWNERRLVALPIAAHASTESPEPSVDVRRSESELPSATWCITERLNTLPRCVCSSPRTEQVLPTRRNCRTDRVLPMFAYCVSEKVIVVSPICRIVDRTENPLPSATESRIDSLSPNAPQRRMESCEPICTASRTESWPPRRKSLNMEVEEPIRAYARIEMALPIAM